MQLSNFYTFVLFLAIFCLESANILFKLVRSPLPGIAIVWQSYRKLLSSSLLSVRCDLVMATLHISLLGLTLATQHRKPCFKQPGFINNVIKHLARASCGVRPQFSLHTGENSWQFRHRSPLVQDLGERSLSPRVSCLVIIQFSAD